MPTTLQQKIEEIFYPYVRINSETGTAAENLTSDYVHQVIQSFPYFAKHPDLCGSYDIPDDPFERKVEWALVRGKGSRTVVLMHHFDVVEIEDYGLLKPYAFDPAVLAQMMRQNSDSLSPEILKDLLSDEWIFGRGTCDMKSGGSIQLALLDEFSQGKDLQGNILLVAVADEENLSAGMLGAVRLMADLKAKFDLDYAVLINSESHTRPEPQTGTLAGGATGKVLPFVYIRGILSHASISAEGFNPLSILSEVIAGSEMSLDLAEIQMAAGEITPPPTWLMARDSKVVYDVSMPLSAFGCLNVFMLNNRPGEVLKSVYDLCDGVAARVTARTNSSADFYHRAMKRQVNRPPWKTTVLDFAGFINRLRTTRGGDFDAVYAQIRKECMVPLAHGEQTMAAATWAILDRLAQLDDSGQPLVVVGFVPPVYPSLSYLDSSEYSALIEHLTGVVDGIASQEWDLHYRLEPYMGVSDLSYTSLSGAAEIERVVASSMPLYGDFYSVPFIELGEISMPCINIGPWGKDFHKLGERVLKQDLFERTPQLVRAAVMAALDWQAK